MNERDFIYWLQGFLELSGATTLNEQQVKIIKDHIALVMTKVTPSLKIQDGTGGVEIPHFDKSMVYCTTSTEIPNHNLTDSKTSLTCTIGCSTESQLNVVSKLIPTDVSLIDSDLYCSKQELINRYKDNPSFLETKLNNQSIFDNMSEEEYDNLFDGDD
jgi:hypothetical protein